MRLLRRLSAYRDIDLVIQSPLMDRGNRKSVLYQLAQVLKRDGIADNVQVIAHAKVPIAKFRSTYGRLFTLEMEQ